MYLTLPPPRATEDYGNFKDFSARDLIVHSGQRFVTLMVPIAIPIDYRHCSLPHSL